MLERIPNSPPKIEALADDANRPLWSVMIPSYNSITYLRDTLNSVLTQIPFNEKMQIEVIDDCSTDGDVEALVKELGKGRIDFFRHSKNIGHYRNFEFCINRAKGRLIHVLHSDDIVKPGFYQEVTELFRRYPSIGAAFTHCEYFDENGNTMASLPQVQEKSGIVDKLLTRLATEILFQPSSVVVKRSVYEHLGSIYGEHYGEDWLMGIRIAAEYDVAYSPKSLTRYRIRSNNLTGQAFVTGQNIKGMSSLINAIQEYLPKEDRRSLKNTAKHNYAFYTTNTVVDRLYYELNNPKAAWKQACGIFRFYPSISTFYCLLKTSMKVLIGYK